MVDLGKKKSFIGLGKRGDPLFAPDNMPKHIAIIMDGNGRWAKKKGLPRAAGHKAGMDALHRVVEWCVNAQIEALTVYAFSTENWKRPHVEVDYLMDLLVEYMQKELASLHEQNICIHPIGHWETLPQKASEVSSYARDHTKNNTGLMFNLAVNYGSRQEIVGAVQKIAACVKANEIQPPEITEALFASYLDTAGQPEPDLLIRTAGNMRLSNFLLWQLAYTELYYTDIYWPDFTGDHLAQAVLDYQKRQRRFGGLDQQQEQ